MKSFLPYLRLMRPWQWVKNLLVFAPLFFVGKIGLGGKFFPILLTFAIFSIAASGVYVLNDIFDRVPDSLHPKKKNRPLASGAISPRKAYYFLVTLFIIEVVLLTIQPVIAPVIIFYITLNGAYTAWFKHIAVVDILCVAMFYVIRIIVGGIAVGVPLSSWIIFCTFFGALFVIVGKRRSEYKNDVRRRVLEQYSKTALDFMLGTSAGLAVIAYGIWSILAHPSPYLVYSTVFVVLALFRMLNRIYTHEIDGESPEFLVFKDRWIFTSFVLWLLYIFLIFYGIV
jgi:decaprenyl-phosphate phosphoribosyltransferase